MLRVTGAATACGFSVLRVCDGCAVAGDGPHRCKTQVVGACVCAVSPACNGYKPLPAYIAPRHRWDLG